METKLKGTPAQIKFANIIRKDNMYHLNYLIKHCDTMISKAPKDKVNTIKQITDIKNALEKVTQVEDASWWIEQGKMGHDFETKDKCLHQLSSASVIANPLGKLQQVGLILKQHKFL